jgi:hypothetical protein
MRFISENSWLLRIFLTVCFLSYVAIGDHPESTPKIFHPFVNFPPTHTLTPYWTVILAKLLFSQRLTTKSDCRSVLLFGAVCEWSSHVERITVLSELKRQCKWGLFRSRVSNQQLSNTRTVRLQRLACAVERCFQHRWLYDFECNTDGRNCLSLEYIPWRNSRFIGQKKKPWSLPASEWFITLLKHYSILKSAYTLVF